ncbi:AsmA-like C-terminal region-containing protein [Tropicimonas isoalkanivorans]|uniref:AsmA-like C-terminal region n=1 Tax=Tropicimonas isoalkanivorans TaxID=441112 RepID=A0A1I1E7X9_9RHOB|nr:AsmA-like C-terminal region-containing protein [Tropicimonas isoalkanivorans]SFB81438.1 AsmA-like C-terminal region [Tropicimonas isoalkanivorans]
MTDQEPNDIAAEAAPPAEDGRTTEGGQGVRRRSRRRKRRALLWGVFLLFDLVLVLGVAVLIGGAMLAGRDLPAPQWVAEKAGAVLSEGLGGGQVEVGQVTLRVEHRSLPEIAFRDVHVTAPNGAELVAVPAVGVRLDKRALLERKVRPEALRVDGATVRLRRKPDGTLDLGFGNGMAPARLGSVEQAIAVVRDTFDLPGLQPIRRIDVQGLDMHFEDQRADKVWRVEDGALALVRDDDTLSLSVDLTLPEGDADPGTETPTATVALRLALGTEAGSPAQFSALVDGVAAREIASQGPALSWLEPLDARVSGALIAALDESDRMETLNGTLEIGEGVFQPERAARPVPFDGARAYFSYEPEDARLRFDELELRSPDGTFAAVGHAYLEGLDTGWPTAIVGQLSFSDVTLDPPGLLPGPAVFETGFLDIKVEFAPFVARIGQFVLTTPQNDGSAASRLETSGRITADQTGWHVALDIGLDEIEAGRLFSLWPLQLVPRTREWIETRLSAGTLFDANAGLRFDQGQRPDASLTFEFRDSQIRPLQSLPPIEAATGYASLGRDVFSLSLDAGRIVPPEGGAVDIAGSVFKIGDLKAEPKVAEILWRSTSPVVAGLSLLDQEPFRFLEKAGQPVDLATGQASVQGRIAFPIRPKLTGSDVDFDIAGEAMGAASDKVVPNRRLTADRLDLHATPEALTVAGAAELDGVPADGTFTLPLGPAGQEQAPAVEGTVRIGEKFVSTFGIGLPDNSVTGAGPAQFRVELPQGAPPTFSLTSALNGVGLSLPTLSWSKRAASEGRLRVAGRLGQPPEVTVLEIEASGLSASGAVSVTPEGALERARFDRLSLAGWLDAPVTLTGRGAGRTPAIAVSGGQLDLRRAPFGGGSGGGGGGGGASGPITLSLDRLQVTDNLSLAPFRGDIVPGSGPAGNFTGRVNGQAPVSGSLAPGQSGGAAVSIRSDNAGAVFKAAGFFRKAEGGTLSLVLQPTGEEGAYDGQLKVENVRLRGASGIAALANAISVVGLLDELSGSGIVFSNIQAAFRLTPRYLQVTRSSGVGPSLGITMEGVYDMVGDRLDMQGVFSPIYMVNSIGSIFTRRGEGLFGVTYRMRGSSDDPSVEVNPLSMLTPGMFREIFRAPPPQPRNGG